MKAMAHEEMESEERAKPSIAALARSRNALKSLGAALDEMGGDEPDAKKDFSHQRKAKPNALEHMAKAAKSKMMSNKFGKNPEEEEKE